MPNLPYIGVDDYKAMYDLSCRLASETNGEIAYFAPVLAQSLSKNNAQRLRVKGFVKAMEDLGRRYRIVVKAEKLDGAGGIVCSTDYYVLKALKKIAYASDVKIAGFDNISILKDLEARVMTVEYSTDQIALECIKYVLGRKYTKKIEYAVVYNMEE